MIPKTGRFVQQDTYGGDETDPQSLNRYSYALNNPTTYIDPTGFAGELPNESGSGMLRGASSGGQRGAPSYSPMNRQLPAPAKVAGLLPAQGETLGSGRRVIRMGGSFDTLERTFIGLEDGILKAQVIDASSGYTGLNRQSPAAGDIHGQMSFKEIAFHQMLSKWLNCTYIVCGRRAETLQGLLNRRFAQKYYPPLLDAEGNVIQQDAPLFKVPSWRNTGANPRPHNEFDHFHSVTDLPKMG